MRFLLLLAGVLFGLSACAPEVPMANQTADAAGKTFETPPSGMAALYITHVDSFTGTPAINVSAGNRSLGGLTNNTWFRVDLPPGQYDVRATGRDGSGALVIALGAGETKFVTAKYTRLSLTPVVAEVTAGEGKQTVLAGRRAQTIQQ